MSGAYQDGTFFVSEGQQSLAAGARVAANPATGKAVDPNSLTFDVRQSRFNFSVVGPQVLAGATPSGVLEIDWFGGFGSGNYGDVSLVPRMRVAYSQLDWGNHQLQFGQQNDLIFAMAPTSLSHIAFPLGYQTGNLGWRRPGVFGFHSIPFSDDTKLQIAWELGRGNWADAGLNTAPANGIGQNNTNTPNAISLAEASSMPAVEGRAMLTQKGLYTVWVAAHASQVDLNGVGPNATRNSTAKQTLSTTSYHAGLKLTFMGVTLAGTGFTGKNISPLVGQFLGFKTGPLGNTDVAAVGYWAQAGYNITKEFSVWGFYGDQKLNKDDAKAAAETRLESTTTNLIAMYRDGGYGLSAEWIHFSTKNENAAFTASTTSNSNQYMVSANYFF